MTSKASYSLEKLDITVQRIKKEGLSYRKAAAQYGIPQSTLHDHVTGKAASSKRGPPTVLMAAEEQMLVDRALHSADIGTQEQLCATVKEIRDKDGRENFFTDNYPGKFNHPPTHPPPHLFTPQAHTHIQTYTCTHTLIGCFPLYRPRSVVWFPQASSCPFSEKTESLQSYRASSCTPERLDKWFADYSKFVHQQGLHLECGRVGVPSLS